MFHGGYFDAQYQLWSPGPIIRIQEDATGAYSPEIYRELIKPVDQKLAAKYPCSFMHLHSTSMFILDLILEIDELKCFEINNDVGGPPIKEMIPYFKKVQNAERNLIIRGTFNNEEISLLINSLDARGLYLYIIVENIDEVDKLKSLLGM